MTIEEAMRALIEMRRKAEEYADEHNIRLRGLTGLEGGLELARRGFVIVGDLHDKPRELSVDELEYLVARRDSNVQ